MVVSYSPNDPFKKERNGSTRLVVVDLTTGKVVGNTLGSGRWEAMAIHDDGETIVVSNKTEGTPLGQLGTVKVAGSKLTLQIVYGGSPIWSGTATNTPGAVSRGTKEEMQKQIDEAGQKPNISYFAATALPEFLQRPEPNATGGRNKQTIGVSRVTATGLQAEK